MIPLVTIIVTVANGALIKQVAETLAGIGVSVQRVLPLTGVITGACPPAVIAALRSVPGVLSVEEELRAELPPAGDSLQ